MQVSLNSNYKRCRMLYGAWCLAGKYHSFGKMCCIYLHCSSLYLEGGNYTCVRNVSTRAPKRTSHSEVTGQDFENVMVTNKLNVRNQRYKLNTLDLTTRYTLSVHILQT